MLYIVTLRYLPKLSSNNAKYQTLRPLCPCNILGNKTNTLIVNSLDILLTNFDYNPILQYKQPKWYQTYISDPHLTHAHTKQLKMITNKLLEHTINAYITNIQYIIVND